MKLFVVIILSLFLIAGCQAQTQLPANLPENVTIYLNESGGMMRYFKKITIDEGVLEFEETKGNRQNPQKWSAKISRAQLAKLYKAFVENKFDLIKNDKREGIVYDAGSESISISLDKLKSFGVTYGKNSPLSGANLARYQAVRRAVYDLIEKNQPASQTPRESENYIQGTWRAAGGDGVRSWFLEWSFDDGKFKQTGYPPIIQEGKYRVLNAAGNIITLELYEQKGTFGEAAGKVEISIDEAANQLTISGTKGFSKITIKKAG